MNLLSDEVCLASPAPIDRRNKLVCQYSIKGISAEHYLMHHTCQVAYNSVQDAETDPPVVAVVLRAARPMHNNSWIGRARAQRRLGASRGWLAYKAGYVAAGHGVLELTKVTALETAEDGVTHNALCPGYGPRRWWRSKSTTKRKRIALHAKR
jgi:NAD(P)-dependent dehydrogenase (short-subunit alcohol dehydrogenase family)